MKRAKRTLTNTFTRSAVNAVNQISVTCELCEQLSRKQYPQCGTYNL